MLSGENARGECLFGVVGEHGHCRLHQDRSIVHFGAHDVDRTTTDPDTGSENVGVSVRASEGRQQRWVNVDDPIAPAIDEVGCQQAHEARKAYEPDIGSAQSRVERAVELRPIGKIPMRDCYRSDAGFACTIEPRGFATIGDDDGDFGWKFRICASVDQRLQIGASSRN